MPRRRPYADWLRQPLDYGDVARDAQAVTFNSSTIVAAAVFYIVFTLPLIWLLDRIIARDQRRMGRGEVVAP